MLTFYILLSQYQDDPEDESMPLAEMTTFMKVRGLNVKGKQDFDAHFNQMRDTVWERFYKDLYDEGLS